MHKAFVLAAAAAAAAAQQSPRVNDAALRRAAQAAEEWLATGRDYAETHYSPLKQIDSGNAGRLGLAWFWDTESTRGLEATPLVWNGTLYATSSWSVVFALDARSGKLKWRWDPEVPRSWGQRACCDVVNRGVALYDGKIYAGALDGRLAAIDAASGKLVWQVQTTDKDAPYTITGAPRVVKGKVIIGNGGAEYGVRGYVSAYDARNGRLAWRFYTVPGDPSKPFESPALARAAKTWNGEWWKFGGGGTAWDAMAYDPEADLLYVGTGNGSPWNRDVRSPGGGDNLYLSSIVALKPDTGAYVWHYQTTPGDNWDYTAVQHILLADLRIGGRTRKALMQAPKNGFFYVLDRVTGEFISAEPYTRVTWASGVDKKTGRPIEVPQARYGKDVVMLSPGPLGGHNWQPMSYNPQTGLVYIPAQDAAFPYSLDAEFRFRKGTWNLSIAMAPSNIPPPDPNAAKWPPGFLTAWDPVAQKERWRVAYGDGSNGGTLTTAGNLVFQGTADGRLVAYSADRGQKLWEVKLGTGVMAAPVTYQLDGKQYVSVLAGWGGAAALFGANPARSYKAEGRVWTFALDGRAVEPVQSRARPAVTPLPSNAAPASVARGAKLYAESCAMCHGQGAASGGTIADLRYSAPAVFQDYRRIVIEGGLQSAGMPAFREWLTGEDAEAIRGFVLAQRAGLPGGR
jgi:quinohemoprotein ethanol dehydrogenase